LKELRKKISKELKTGLD